MTKSTNNDLVALEALHEAAEAKVGALEALELGAPIAGARREAIDAIDELRDPAESKLFPKFVDPDANVIALIQFRETDWTRETYIEGLLDLHAHLGPSRGAFLRSPAVIDGRVVTLAKALAASWARPASDVIDEVREEYRRALAADLVLDAELGPYAVVIAAKVPQLEARVAACEAKHMEHARAEVERIQREAREAEERDERFARERRDRVARKFDAQPYTPFIVRNTLTVIGLALAQAARQEEARDDYGNVITPPLTIDELELVLRRAEASAAVEV